MVCRHSFTLFHGYRLPINAESAALCYDRQAAGAFVVLLAWNTVHQLPIVLWRFDNSATYIISNALDRNKLVSVQLPHLHSVYGKPYKLFGATEESSRFRFTRGTG